jgi:dienelactone hydrolase
MRAPAAVVPALLFILATAAAQGQTEPAPAYAEVFYPSGELRIQAYLYRPEGNGPFPIVIYNHGTRDGRERESLPFPHIGRMLTRAGYGVLVSERRGYGKSGGAMWWQETGNDPSRVVSRLQDETGDVLAAIDYLRTVPFADTKRMAVMGWSFGGIVTMMALSRSSAFAAAINQAGGALTWDANPFVRKALISAAEQSSTPTLLMVAKNDRTTDSITTLADVYQKRAVPHQLLIYDAFTPPRGGVGRAPGHALFSASGANLWEGDVVKFLDKYLGARAP